MSETCPILTLATLKPHMLQWPEEEQIKIRCRTGLPINNVELQLLDPEGKAVPHDGKSTGEVVVRCAVVDPGLFQG